MTHRGRKGIYFFGRYLGTKRSWLSQRTVALKTYEADFEIVTEREGRGYASYVCHSTSAAGETSFSLRSARDPDARAPFTSGEEHAQFLTYRLHGFYTSSAGIQGYMPVEHPRMDPVAGELNTARLDLWDELGIVGRDEVDRPYSVLTIPAVPFTLFAPRPLLG